MLKIRYLTLIGISILSLLFISILVDPQSLLFNQQTSNESFTLDVDFRCEKVIYIGDQSEKIDIVFVPYGYSEDELPIFISSLPEFIGGGNGSGILSKEPFSSNSDKFNFYYLNQSVDSLDIINSIVSSVCSFYDEIIVLDFDSESDGRAATGGHLAYVSSSGSIESNTRTLIHEFGHSFGALKDEYSSDYPSREPTKHPNCDDFGCPKWCNGTSTFQEPRKEECERATNKNDCLDTMDCFWISACYTTLTGYEEECEKRTNVEECKDDTNCEWRGNSTCLLRLGSDVNYGTGCMEDTGCYHGCEGYHGYRATLEGCIMRYGNEFCPICQRELCNKIKETTGYVNGVCCQYDIC